MAPASLPLSSRTSARRPADPLALTTLLTTPPVRCVAPAGVFDAFAWCRSDQLEWRRPARVWDLSTPLDGSPAERMVFVLKRECDFLPKELARLHATGLGLGEEVALAPWGIDAATDGLFERRVPPGELFWLAADNLNAVFWGLHDWAHFHHHGPFDDRPWTELQCDAAALAWMWVNRAALALTPEAWECARLQAEALSKLRFGEVGTALQGRDELGGAFEHSARPFLGPAALRAMVDAHD